MDHFPVAALDQFLLAGTKRRYAEGGLAALGRGPGYPKGTRPRLPATQAEEILRLKKDGVATRDLARRLGP